MIFEAREKGAKNSVFDDFERVGSFGVEVLMI